MKLNKKALAILSAAHFVTDINQGALPALLPFFKEALNLSYTMSGAILLSANLTSSIIQPAFGHLSDRRPIGWFLPLSPFIACLGIVPYRSHLKLFSPPHLCHGQWHWDCEFSSGRIQDSVLFHGG